jgi:hypothetical protein
MPELPQRKVGLVSCSGEEMPEGTISRLATRRVLETLRPGQTVTICLPLFLAGGEGDRAFARFCPTIAIDGCEKRCAARGTEMYSGKPAASIVVTELSPRQGCEFGTARRLSVKGQGAVEVTADAVSQLVDQLLETAPSGVTEKEEASGPPHVPTTASCSCGSGISMRKLHIAGGEIQVLALPLIYESWRNSGKLPNNGISSEMLQTIKVYHPIPENEEDAWRQAITLDYALFCLEKR